MNDLIKINQSEINGSEVNSVNARDIYKYLEVKTAYTTWLQRTVDKYGFIGEVDYKSLSNVKPSGQTEKLFIVTLDMAKELCMITDTQKGKEVRKYFIAIEKEANKPMTEIELARKHLANLERIEALQIENKELEKTKAYISDKKTATAMNTASQAVKKANKLENELDKSKEYCTIKRMSMINHGQKFSFKLLRDTANELNSTSIDVFDANYGTVKAYHKSTWIEAYGLEF